VNAARILGLPCALALCACAAPTGLAGSLARSGPDPSVDVGEVTHRISGCDYFLVETKSGYDLLEWYSGDDPDEGDTIAGKFESYGFHDVVDTTADDTLRVYTEDYQLSKSDALEKLVDACN
jgi:hypothetical protein